MFDAGVVERLIARARAISQAYAAFYTEAVAVADATPVAEFAGFEISCALVCTPRSADIQLELAQNIVRRLPAVHTAMTAGDVDLAKARVIVDGVSILDLTLARAIVAQILPLAPGLTTGELRARLAKLVIQADPEAAAKRRLAQVRQRRVELQPTEDGCANLLGLNLPAEDALAASNRLTALARAIKKAGDPRSLDQLRADTFLNLLLGNTTGGTGSGGVELTGDLEMLARLADNPGHLSGYGPVIADIARQVAQQQRQSPWTFTIRDPATGDIFTGTTRHRPHPDSTTRRDHTTSGTSTNTTRRHATRRHPTEALARHVRARDRTCRAPGCRRPATHADIDHTIAYHLGGLTIASNLGVLCRYHHRAKHEGWWLLVQVRPGVFVWRSPLGRRYTVYPAAP
ncbi:hypothetical protein Rhe02_67520 [Rhizocola hellebori]|uniref:HNH nuclease domain-containing protein n=1 Tax=Rhizocola hellebori TaxID=1392758 RepID=A0A8J3QDE0_9ACTN|nr:HNH endonuclease signature motif containing protein [Rhizocola hellebori]GIH08685.1 hypothetical protein Rhe02_67520 [Rhizocola hellebori]